MNNISPSLNFIINVARFHSAAARRFDSRLGNGIGFTDFLILYHLNLAPEQKLRRTDLAEKLGYTPSGITRLLAPMEKIGLVKRETSPHDARVSFVSLAPSGKRILNDEMEDAEYLAEELLPGDSIEKLHGLAELLTKLERTSR